MSAVPGLRATIQLLPMDVEAPLRRSEGHPVRHPGSTSLAGSEREGAAVKGWVVGLAVGPGTPDHAQPGSGQDADGVGVIAAACASGLCRRPLAQSLAWRELSARQVMAWRSRWLQAQRKATLRVLPDWYVTGTAPASAAS